MNTKSDLEVYNKSLKNIRDKIKQRISEGWTISNEYNSLFLLPPKNDKKMGWASVWTPVVFDNKILYIAHWTFDK